MPPTLLLLSESLNLNQLRINGGTVLESLPSVNEKNKSSTVMPALVIPASEGGFRRYIFTEESVSIGRGSQNQIVLDDPSVSKFHAELFRSEGHWSLRDLGSANGTTLNGHEVVESRIGDGNKLSFAGVECYFTDSVEVIESEAEAGILGVSEGSFRSRLTGLGSALIEEGKKSAKKVALKARMQLLLLNLSRAHYEFGKNCHEQGILCGQFSSRRECIFDLELQLKNWSTDERNPTTQSVGGRIQGILKNATVCSEMEAVEDRLKQEFTEFGMELALSNENLCPQGWLDEIKSLNEVRERLEKEYAILNADSSALDEMTQFSTSIAERAALQFSNAGESFVEIITGTPSKRGKQVDGGGVPAQITLGESTLVGRDARCELMLPLREVSQMHAVITRQGNGYLVRDLNSSIGTFVNGKKIHSSTQLIAGDSLRFGSSVFFFDGTALFSHSEKDNSRISLLSVGKSVISRDTGKPLKLLDEISLVIEPKQFVALLGSSGSGKSTLMDAISGRRPASSGRVLINKDDFYRLYQYYRRAIGYVPQQDIVHRTLSVAQALRFAARLRLPDDTSRDDLERIIEEVISKLGLEERRHTLISDLSGGQLKRVSLGVELISNPSLFFLDEATSGLDSGTEAKMMALFRQIADDGATVVCITHNIENVNLCDLTVVLAKGKLAYFGPPNQLAEYFGVSKISEVYDRLDERSADEWASLYQNSAFFGPLIREKIEDSIQIVGGLSELQKQRASKDELREAVRQFNILRQRYSLVLLSDLKNLAFLLLQAPIIGILIGVVFYKKGGKSDLLILFLLVVSSIWFGCSNASKEVVKELPIYLRERTINLKISSYLASKMVVLSVLSFLQCLVMAVICVSMTGIDVGLLKLFCLLSLISVAGLSTGLLLSTLFSNTDKVSAIVPVVLIPQVIFAGVIVPLNPTSLAIARSGIVSFWATDAALHLSVSTSARAQQTMVFDVFMIFVFSAVFYSLATLALRRKDVF